MKTTKSYAIVAMLLGGFLFCFVAAPALQAQRKKTTKSTTTKKVKYAHRLPSHFRQIGISEEQKAKVYKIQDKYSSEINDLKKQLAALQEKQMGECEDLLSTRQKSALSKLRNKKKPTKKTSATKSSSSRSTKSSSTKSSTKKSGTSKKK